MNLKKEYRDFIKSTAKIIHDLEIDKNLTKDKCVSIFKTYQTIHNSMESSSLNVNDVNHIIMNYNKENEDVEALKKFIRIKNLYLIKKVVQSSLWNLFIMKLLEDPNFNEIKLHKKKKYHLMEKGVYRLLKSTIDQFRGCWEIAEFNDDKIKKLEIIEPEHYEFLINYIKEKMK